MNPSGTQMKQYFPWIMALTGLLVLLVSNGMTAPGLTVFDDKLLHAFGWTRGELKMRALITMVLTGWLGPLMGVIVDRIGPRKLILFGIALLAVLYFAYAYVDNLAELYLIHFGFAMVLITAGMPVTVIFVSKWFTKRRGTALGIALVGVSLGGMALPEVGVHLLQHTGWRSAFMWEALIPIIALVIFIFLVRTPRSGGIRPWGAEDASAPAGDSFRASEKQDLSYKQALHSRTFWALTCVSVTTFYSIMAIAQNLFLHMRGMGFDPVTAGNALALMFGMALISKLVFGALSDIFPPKLVFLFDMVVMLAGAVVLATMRVSVVWDALVLIGVGWGGLYAMIQLHMVNSFGLSAMGKIIGTVTLFEATSAGLGIWLTAKIYDVTGSYESAFWLIVILLFLGLIAATLVRDERKHLTAQAF